MFYRRFNQGIDKFIPRTMPGHLLDLRLLLEFRLEILAAILTYNIKVQVRKAFGKKLAKNIDRDRWKLN